VTPIRVGLLLSGVVAVAWLVLVISALHSHDSLAGIAVVGLTGFALASLFVIWFGVLLAWGWSAGAKARDQAGPRA